MISWSKFLIILSALYFFYYAFHLLYDLFSFSPENTAASEEESVFMLTEEPALIDASLVEAQADLQSESTAPFLSSGEAKSSGGVNIKEMIELAAEDAVESIKRIAA